VHIYIIFYSVLSNFILVFMPVKYHC